MVYRTRLKAPSTFVVLAWETVANSPVDGSLFHVGFNSKLNQQDATCDQERCHTFKAGHSM